MDRHSTQIYRPSKFGKKLHQVDYPAGSVVRIRYPDAAMVECSTQTYASIETLGLIVCQSIAVLALAESGAPALYLSHTPPNMREKAISEAAKVAHTMTCGGYLPAAAHVFSSLDWANEPLNKGFSEDTRDALGGIPTSHFQYVGTVDQVVMFDPCSAHKNFVSWASMNPTQEPVLSTIV